MAGIDAAGRIRMHRLGGFRRHHMADVASHLDDANAFSLPRLAQHFCLGMVHLATTFAGELNQCEQDAHHYSCE